MKLSIRSVCILIILSSCRQYPARVNDALTLAGSNAPELKKVLNYYKGKDRQKYDAACFLISNMPYHKAKDQIANDTAYSEYFNLTDSLYNILFKGMTVNQIYNFPKNSFDSLRKSLVVKFLKIPVVKRSKALPDIKVIKADYLIDNINCAFAVWKESPLLRNISYEDFKELILPYRTTDECITYKRSVLAAKFKNQISVDGMKETVIPIARYKAYVMKQRWFNSYIATKDHIGIYDLFLPSFKMDCHNVANWTCDVFRALGIPVAYEYTPQWVDRERRHYWCASPDSSGIFQPYTPPDNNLGEDWDESLRFAGKVYRRTYAANEDSPYFLKSNNEIIPDNFISPTIKDVTFRYHQTVTLQLPFRTNTKNNLAYLSFFTKEDGLVPVAWGRINKWKNKVLFEQVPVNMVFILTYFDGEKSVAVDLPFYLRTDGNIDYISKPRTTNENANAYTIIIKDRKSFGTNITKDIKYHYLAPDTNNRVNLHLLNKYPPKLKFLNMSKTLKGACLLGSYYEKGPYDTLLILSKIPAHYMQEYELLKKNKYRYYIFETKGRKPLNLAEIEFLGTHSVTHSCSYPTPLPIFIKDSVKFVTGNPTLRRIDGNPLNTSKSIENAFDRNMDTYIASSRVGMDFKIPIEITHLRMAPRNGNNMIVIGDTYELNYYYDNEWKQFGISTAIYNCLDFNKVPSNSLYLLRNLSGGEEELPFLYLNGKQIFINQLGLISNSLQN